MDRSSVRSVTDDLAVVAVRADDESGVVTGVVTRTQLRRAVVLPAGCERLAVKSIHLCAALRDEREMQRRRRRARRHQPERCLVSLPESDRIGIVHQHSDGERRKRAQEELLCGGEIRDRDDDMVEHYGCPSEPMSSSGVNTLPSLITRWMRLRCWTSVSGSASSTTRSASLPAASVPASRSRPIARAPFTVAARRTCSGVRPACTISSISRNTDGPCNVPMLPASVPMTTGTPASQTLRRLARSTAERFGGTGVAIAFATRAG